MKQAGNQKRLNQHSFYRRNAEKFLRVLICFILLTLPANLAIGHPHVFVDGGIDFVMRDNKKLEALKVTWLIDEFETLYLLADYGVKVNKQGGLDEDERQKLISQMSDWPDHFEGSSHLSFEDKSVPLELPVNLDADLIDGKLMATFTRRLKKPIIIDQQLAEVGFYDSTYYYAFFVANKPKVFGTSNKCTTHVIKFDPDEQQKELQATLSKLSREETTGILNIGSLFADRIYLQCD